MLRIYSIPVGIMKSNCYVAFDDRKAVIIDPGADGERIIKAIKNTYLTPEAILLTHAHFDHFGAANEISEHFDIPVIVDVNDKHFLTDPDLNLSMSHLYTPVTFDGKVEVVHNQTLKLIGHNFSFIATPGHTPGSSCILVNDKLFTGDTLFKLSIGRAFAPYGNTEQIISSIKNKICIYEKDFICFPGHGEQTNLFYEMYHNPFLI